MGAIPSGFDPSGDRYHNTRGVGAATISVVHDMDDRQRVTVLRVTDILQRLDCLAVEDDRGWAFGLRRHQAAEL